VIVSEAGEVLAEGWHRGPGSLHAEADALAQLGGRAPGATLYVNLEPCAHRTPTRRTQPCAPLVAASGIRRMVYGLRDPFPGHGGGAEEVAAAGITVDGPILEDECRRANAPFVTVATSGRVHVTLKAAMTLDGRIATRTGESRWITGEAARASVHVLRDKVDAILVGAGTVIADDPRLTTRGVANGRDPVRVVLDGKLRTPPGAKVLPAIVATCSIGELPGAELIRFAGDRVDLRELCKLLAERGLSSLLVEGGAETHAAFLAAGLADRLLLHVAPAVFGGPAPAWVGGPGVAAIADAPRWRLVSATPLGDDLALEYERADR
jgi:diaminohydroxyphosphoribosylaminopyrimidine deaminase/5-amino-6-(5-phosphoribosylamino)uracil reductase